MPASTGWLSSMLPAGGCSPSTTPRITVAVAASPNRMAVPKSSGFTSRLRHSVVTTNTALSGLCWMVLCAASRAYSQPEQAAFTS